MRFYGIRRGKSVKAFVTFFVFMQFCREALRFEKRSSGKSLISLFMLPKDNFICNCFFVNQGERWERCFYSEILFIPYYDKKFIMSIEEAGKILSAYFQVVDSVEHFTVTGGEPLLNIPVLIYLDENIKKITDKIGIVYKAFLTTNGSMLSKELLQKVKFSSIQLTFDGLEKTHDRLRVSDHFHFKEEIELIENIMNFSQAKVLLRTNICKENKDEIIALHKYIFEKFGNERIEINPNRTIKYHQDDSFEMLSVQEYAEVAYQIKLLWSEQKGKFELPVPRSTPCKFPYGNAYAISPEGYCTFCSGSMDQEKKYFFDVDIENKKMFSVRKECKKCNILPLCLGGCIIQYNLRAGACTYEKYELKNILISYIKHIS